MSNEKLLSAMRWNTIVYKKSPKGMNKMHKLLLTQLGYGFYKMLFCSGTVKSRTKFLARVQNTTIESNYSALIDTVALTNAQLALVCNPKNSFLLTLKCKTEIKFF